MNVFELAKKYYPILWYKSRIDTLHKLGKLTDAEYQELIGETE